MFAALRAILCWRGFTTSGTNRRIGGCYFVEILQQSQPKISRHLAYLRKAGVVIARRDGKWIHYRIEMPQDAAAAAILDEVLRALECDPEMLADAKRLSRACCSSIG